MILRESRGELSTAAFREYLHLRDARLDLEYDVAWANQFVIGHLLHLFPESKFIILIRDSYTWLQSITGHLISRHVPSDVLGFLNWWFKPERYPLSRHDLPLAEQGLFPIAAYLHAWNHHIDECTRLIPKDRRLMIRTHELTCMHQRLADFLQIPVDSLDVDKGHQNRSSWSDRIESFVDPSYIDDLVQSICAENLALYFPELASARDVSKLWKAVPGVPST